MKQNGINMGIVSIGVVTVGLIFALFLSPPDYQQKETVRIMYIHVPAAWMSLMIYLVKIQEKLLKQFLRVLKKKNVLAKVSPKVVTMVKLLCQSI